MRTYLIERICRTPVDDAALTFSLLHSTSYLRLPPLVSPAQLSWFVPAALAPLQHTHSLSLASQSKKGLSAEEKRVRLLELFKETVRPLPPPLPPSLLLPSS